jgi:hypothetical protein
LRVGAPGVDVRPVADGDAHDVQAGISDLLEILERDEGVPVRLECVVAALSTEFLAESLFVDDGPVGGAVGFEDGWCDEAGLC